MILPGKLAVALAPEKNKGAITVKTNSGNITLPSLQFKCTQWFATRTQAQTNPASRFDICAVWVCDRVGTWFGLTDQNYQGEIASSKFKLAVFQRQFVNFNMFLFGSRTCYLKQDNVSSKFVLKISSKCQSSKYRFSVNCLTFGRHLIPRR